MPSFYHVLALTIAVAVWLRAEWVITALFMSGLRCSKRACLKNVICFVILFIYVLSSHCKNISWKKCCQSGVVEGENCEKCVEILGGCLRAY